MGVRTNRATECKRVIWDWIDEHHPEWWDNDDEDNPRFLVENLARLARMASVGGRCIRTSEVRDWLSNPRRHTPHLDEVAIDRAMDFDWPVVRSLTVIERQHLARRLAAHDDPWGDLETGNDADPGNRALAFRDGTRLERDALIRLVNEYGRREDLALAA